LITIPAVLLRSNLSYVEDIDRWWSFASGFFMIVLKSSANFEWPWANACDEQKAEAIFAQTYPSLYRHLKAFEEWTDTTTNKKAGLRQREDQGRFWWELRSSKYYEAFDQGYIAYQDIAFNSAFEIKRAVFPEMTAFCLPTICPVLLATLNSPVMWYFMSRAMLHGKDEAIRCNLFQFRTVRVKDKTIFFRRLRLIFPGLLDKSKNLTFAFSTGFVTNSASTSPTPRSLSRRKRQRR